MQQSEDSTTGERNYIKKDKSHQILYLVVFLIPQAAITLSTKCKNIINSLPYGSQYRWRLSLFRPFLQNYGTKNIMSQYRKRLSLFRQTGSSCCLPQNRVTIPEAVITFTTELNPVEAGCEIRSHNTVNGNHFYDSRGSKPLP